MGYEHICYGEWWEDPRDVLLGVKLLLAYLGERNDLFSKVGTKGWRRAMYGRAWDRAARMLGVRKGRDSDGLWYWQIHSCWRARLKDYGIDPVSIRVIDERRWAICWELLVKGQLRVGEFKRLVAMGYETKAAGRVAARPSKNQLRKEAAKRALDAIGDGVKLPELGFYGEVNKAILKRVT